MGTAAAFGARKGKTVKEKTEEALEGVFRDREDVRKADEKEADPEEAQADSAAKRFLKLKRGTY
jgi:hypothetical protein